MVLRNILSGPFDDEGGAQECERKNTIIPFDGLCMSYNVLKGFGNQYRYGM